jgi:hypothetical protein
MFVTAKNEAKRKFVKQNKAEIFFLFASKQKFEAKRSKNKQKNWSFIFA